ncbi:MAG: ATP synthase F0 subunit C [Nitrospirae bacterium]|nr:ATP synthase F0 subunit C [Nitrospirota bacterium]MBF0591392.1 ATP synthase F0 subunit C [Nitrospirota bacterium]
MKKLSVVLLVLMMMFVFAPIVFAETGAEGANASSVKAMAAIGGGLAIGIAALGTGIGQGIGLSKACEGVARNPGASGKVMVILIVGLGMIESLCLYAFLLSLGMLKNQNLFF